LRILYKYLPIEFAERFVQQGEVLFRSLSYFRAVEHAARGDEAEGIHIDAPDNDMTIEADTGVRVVGRFRYLRSINQERIFAFCCSTQLDEKLFVEFNSDACVVIRDTGNFFLRCNVKAQRLFSLDPPGLLHREVSYFAPNREAPLDITNPRNIPFLKHVGFAEQSEYRTVFARRRGFTMTERIVAPAFTFTEEIAVAQKHERLLKLGNLSHITELVFRR
jgi:hypothetical protein